MTVQLQLNQGPQDALLYDNSRSYFTNVGYVRTSNFQIEYKEVPPQSTPALGQTVTFVIPKSADLLGPVDLMVELEVPDAQYFTHPTSTTATTPFANCWEDAEFEGAASAFRSAYWQYVDELGYAMIDKMTFAVGPVDVETLTGDQLRLKNELMTSDEMRFGYEHSLKTGRAACGAKYGKFLSGEKPNKYGKGKVLNSDYSRILVATEDGGTGELAANKEAAATTESETVDNVVTYNVKVNNYRQDKKRTLIIPLKFFFTEHVSTYFPLGAIAGCNELRVTVKLRTLDELLQCRMPNKFSSSTARTLLQAAKPKFGSNSDPLVTGETKLMCHYVHLTGPEAQTLATTEHVRLMKLYQTVSHNKVLEYKTKGKWTFDLSFLHPVTCLIIEIKRADDKNTLVDGSAQCAGKGYFFLHGDGTNPNYDEPQNDHTFANRPTLKVQNIDLTLNGNSRHPGLSDGISHDYLKHRLMSHLHSNADTHNKHYYAVSAHTEANHRTGNNALGEMNYRHEGSKNYIVYPFSLAPEGLNPSGAVNFSKVSHAKLTLTYDAILFSDSEKTYTDNTSGQTASNDTFNNFEVTIHAMHYNWLQVKSGRALLSFA